MQAEVNTIFNIIVIECAIQTPALECYRQLQQNFPHNFSYHAAPQLGMDLLANPPFPDAYIIFGSYSNVADRLPWQIELKNFILQQLSQNIPVLGICFGHQLIVDGLGGEIDLMHSDALLLEGVRNVKTSPHPSWPFTHEELALFISHRYGISKLPPDFDVIGIGHNSAYDIVCHKTLPFLGVQPHPEGSLAFIDETLSGQKLDPNQINNALKGGKKFMSIFFKGVESFLKNH